MHFVLFTIFHVAFQDLTARCFESSCKLDGKVSFGWTMTDCRLWLWPYFPWRTRVRGKFNINSPTFGSKTPRQRLRLAGRPVATDYVGDTCRWCLDGPICLGCSQVHFATDFCGQERVDCGHAVSTWATLDQDLNLGYLEFRPTASLVYMFIASFLVWRFDHQTIDKQAPGRCLPIPVSA